MTYQQEFKKRKFPVWGWVLLGIGALIVLCGGGAMVAAVSTVDSVDSALKTPTPMETEAAPGIEATENSDIERAEQEAPDLTTEQEQAIRVAQDYLNWGFSKTGLIEQLEFEGFSKDDAKFAVNFLEIDWKEQAAISAELYLNTQGMSRQGLIEQLMFDGFTEKQAEHGADEVGL